jgi:hypothetical protein
VIRVYDAAGNGSKRTITRAISKCVKRGKTKSCHTVKRERLIVKCCCFVWAALF